MKKLQSIRPRTKFLALSFLIPFLGYTAVMLVSGYTPFGNSSILYSDMYHQYYPFFVEFRASLRNGQSLLYNWNLGMGVDYLALIAYYLASPLNLLSVLVPGSMLLGYFSMLVPIKLGLAGLFFGIFLNRTFQKADWSIPLFSGCYGLCAWALGYQWNLMWLDTFALLPLVILGMVNLLQKRRFILYTCTLFLSIASNYYIGLFTCIFVALCFVCYEICYFGGWKRILGDLGLMALFSAIAIAMTAFLEWPAFVALGNTHSSVNQFPKGFKLNIADKNTWLGLLDAMRQVAGNTAGGLSPSFKEGLPNLYCGILPLMLMVQFLATKKFKIREKLCSLFLLLFFMLSFIIRQLDYIWHGFHFTNMIPYRFSFLFSFVVLVMAYRAYLLAEDCKPWKAILSGLVFLGLAACSDSRTDPVFLIYNLVFLVIYLTLLLARKHPGKQTIELEEGPAVVEVPLTEAETARNRKLSWLLSAAIGLELVCCLVNFGVNFGGTSVVNYPRGTRDAADVISYMKEQGGSGYYRTEFTHTQTLNDDALNGVRGITIFSSSVNERVTNFMNALGFGAKPSYNRYAYEEASPVSNLFLNLRYLICRDGKLLDNNLFTNVYNMGNVYLLENKAYLPLGFLVDPAFGALSVEDPDAGSIRFQNDLFSAATGIDEPVYEEVSDYLMSSDEATVNQRGTGGYGTYETQENAGDVTVSFQVPSQGFVCLDLSVSKRNGITVYKNDEEVLTESLGLDQMLAVGSCQAGDKIELVFGCKANESGRIDLTAAVMDEELYLQGAEVLRESVLLDDGCTGTQVTGAITARKDGLLYTSIPYDGNWTVAVDGQEAELVTVLDAMVGVYLTEGSHTVTFTYHNDAFYQGLAVSAAALVLFLGLVALAYGRMGKFRR